MIPYGRQLIDEQDIEAVVSVLRSDWLTQGPAVPRFEQVVAEYCGAGHAVAVNSATSALHLACLALDVGPGDVVWTSPITFVASANCARYCGADVDFVDIDPATCNISPAALAGKLKQTRNAGGRLPKAVIPVHFSGQSCDMAEIGRLAGEYGFRVIEDAAHAIGGRYRDKPVGSCEHSDIAVFSFHPVKVVTSGEGGMAVTNDAGLAERMARLRSHGITHDSARMTHVADGPWYYQQLELGFNYRMTDIQAALGISQMSRLDNCVARRRLLARRYNELLADLPVKTPGQDPDGTSAYHLYVVRLRIDEIQPSQGQVFEGMRAQGIGVQVHYIPVHLQPYYRRLGFAPGDHPEAEAYYGEALSLPIFVALTESQQDEVVAALRKSLRS